MRKTAFAFMFMASALAIAETDPTHWYTPTGGEWKGDGTGRLKISVAGLDKSFEVDPNGASVGLDKEIAAADKAGNIYLGFALRAIKEALVAQVQVNNMASNLDNLLDGGSASYSSGAGDSPTTGGYSFKKGADGKLTLDLTGVTGVTAGRGLTKVSGQIGLSMWAAASDANTLANVLSGKGPDLYETYDVLCRSGANGTLSYLKIGSGLGAGSNKVDGVTISQNSDGELGLKNWAESGSSIAASGFAIPYSDSASDGLMWTSLADLFDSSFFRYDQSSKEIMLKGGGSDGQVLHTDGDGEVFWGNPPPSVSYDGDRTITITPQGADDSGVTAIALPDFYVEEDEQGYTLYYFPLNGEDWADPVTIPYASASNSCDNVTIDKNGDGEFQIKGYTDELGGNKYVGTGLDGSWGVHDLPQTNSCDNVTIDKNDGGEFQVKGYSDGLGNKKYLGTGAEGAWGVHDLPSVTTNSVNADNVTITSTESGGVKTLGLLNWPSGGGRLALVSDGGTINYVPFPEIGGTNGVVTVVDDVSISSNSTGKIEIKGFASGDNPCQENIADLLTADSDDTYQHQFLTRAGTGEKTLHYLAMGRIPHPDSSQFDTDGDTKKFVLKTQEGKLLQGTSGNGISWVDPPSGVSSNVVDGVSIVMDEADKIALKGVSAQNAGKMLSQDAQGVAWVDPPSTNAPDGVSIVLDEDGKLAIKGLDDDSSGKVLTQTAEGVKWKDPADAIPVDNASVTTNAGAIALFGFANAGDNAVPRKSNGTLVWGGASSATNTYVAGEYIDITDGGGGVATISAQSTTVDVITDISFSFDDGGQLVATITKQTVTVLDKASSTSEATATIPLWKQNVVVSSEYNASTHQFTNNEIGSVRTTQSSATTPAANPVFTATAHSGQ